MGRDENDETQNHERDTRRRCYGAATQRQPKETHTYYRHATLYQSYSNEMAGKYNS